MEQLYVAAFDACKRITYKHAKTFYFASHFLPKEKRNACYAVYAFCRYVDDIVDVGIEEKGLTVSDAVQLVNQWHSDVASLYSNNVIPNQSSESHYVLRAWEDVLSRYHIPRRLPEELISGVLMDTVVSRFDTFEHLREYCYKVASVVGLMTSEIFGYSDSSALRSAVDLGIAMQLTNILRDVKEDAQRNRIYIPQEFLHKYRVPETNILHNVFTTNMRELIKDMIALADTYYSNADAGIPLLSADSRVTVRLMSRNYRKILRVIERQDYNVFLRRARTTTLQKLIEVPKALFS